MKPLNDKIYTAGYRNFSFYEFRDLVVQSNFFIVDVRYRPWSRIPFWTKDHLSISFTKYAHIPEFGNRYYNSKDKIEVVDLVTGFEKIDYFMGNEPILLLCACEDYEACHRKIVAEYISEKTGLSIVNI